MKVTTILGVTASVLSAVTFGLGGCGSSKDDGAGGSAGATAKLVINEIQPSNQDTITDDHGEADDWIEVYNFGSNAVDLKSFVFSDSKTPHAIPSTLMIQPGSYLLLWADKTPSQGPNHLGFKLGATEGDAVSIHDPNGNLIDTTSFGADATQNSWARFPNATGAFAWCDKPTPGAANGSACGVP